MRSFSRVGSCAFACLLLVAATWAAHPGASGLAPGSADAATGAAALADALADTLARAEYHASATSEGIQAPNRAQQVRTWFRPWGIRVHGRREPAFHFGLRLERWGRGIRLDPVPRGRVVAQGERVEIRRTDPAGGTDLVEWYVNRATGIEQGFTVESHPGGGPQVDGPPLVLEIAIEGAVAEHADADAALLRSSTGRLFAYDQLLAWDAAGRALPVELQRPDPQHLRLVVNDQGARYPIVIDPLISAGLAQRVRGGQADTELGFSVAGAGDVNADGFDDVIVGAFLWDGGQADEGAAFLFLGGPDGIGSREATAADARLEGDQAGAQLGISVAAAGDVDDDGYGDVIVGARHYAQATDGGAAFVWHGSASGIGNGSPATADTVLVSDQAGALFGASVAGAGDVDADGFDDVIVGAYQYSAGQQGEGAAFVFRGSATGVPDGDTATAHARLEGDQAFALLGLSVAGAGDVNGDGYDDVVVGAPLYDDGQVDEGAAFVFHGSPSGIAPGGVASAQARVQSDQASANFGFQVAGAGDVDGDGYDDVLVGADEYDDGEDSEGAAFLFRGSSTGIASTGALGADTRLQSDQAGADFGRSVSSAGDVDADGYADVLVGANLWDEHDDDVGAAFLYLGGAGGIPSGGVEGAASQLLGGEGGASFGVSVAAAGDVDGDGRTDVLVGASDASPQIAGEGAAYLFLEPLEPPPVPLLGQRGALALVGLLVALGLREAARRATTGQDAGPT